MNRFKVLIPPAARVGAGTTETFDTRAEAETFVKTQRAEARAQIVEVDELGRPTTRECLPERSVGGGIENYLCSHCRGFWDAPDVNHDCNAFGRDNAAPKFAGIIHGNVTIHPLHGYPERYAADFHAEGACDFWRAVLLRHELLEFLEPQHWHGETLQAALLGTLSASVSVDAETLKQFWFRHILA
ncbi:MAG: hypothetical protein ACHP7I_06805 [Terriglobales bacterium]